MRLLRLITGLLLYGSLLMHFALALASLYRRSTLRMPIWEAAQMLLGLAIPPLLIAHIVGTRFTWTLLGHNIDYERVVGLLWSSEWEIARQSLLLLIVWAHVCAGLHYWSAEALRQAGIEPGDSPQHQVRVRGKTERLTVHAVADPRTLKQGQTTVS